MEYFGNNINIINNDYDDDDDDNKDVKTRSSITSNPSLPFFPLPHSPPATLSPLSLNSKGPSPKDLPSRRTPFGSYS